MSNYALWNIKLDDSQQEETSRKIYDVECLAAINYFNALKKADLVDMSFPAGDVYDVVSWLKALQRPSNTSFFVINGSLENPLAHCHFNSILGYTGVMHFSILPTMKFTKLVEMGKETMRLLSEVKRVDGTPLFTTVMGITPETNRRALAYARLVGFRHIITIPDMMYVKKIGGYVPGVLTKYTLREGL